MVLLVFVRNETFSSQIHELTYVVFQSGICVRTCVGLNIVP